MDAFRAARMDFVHLSFHMGKVRAVEKERELPSVLP